MTAPTTPPPSTSVSSPGNSLTLVPRDQFPSLVPYVPDTPWTTTALHLLQRRHGKVFVDNLAEPGSLVVIAPGDPQTRTPDEALLLGDPESEALKTFVAAIRSPMSLVCDDTIGEMVKATLPDAREHDAIVHWYDRLADAESVAAEPGPRRLRIAESEAVAALLPGWALRTWRTPKDLVMGSQVYVIEEAGSLVAAAFSLDQSFKYERVCAVTVQQHRLKGHGLRALKKLVRSITDQSRMACAVVDRRDAAGLALAGKLGFTRKARVRCFITSLKK